jgi:hypothetical protein
MNYYFDTEFLEGKQKKKILGVKYGETKHTIDLISIGVVSEDNRGYYAISNEFNLDEAWNRFQVKKHTRFQTDGSRLPDTKEYWIRENVLLPVYLDLLNIGNIYGDERNYWSFTKSNLRRLIKWYGKSNSQIAEEIKSFCSQRKPTLVDKATDPVFYAYYADYDWVVFCWLFGTMMDLPKGFPMYCKDLKQILDEKVYTYKFNMFEYSESVKVNYRGKLTFKQGLELLKMRQEYPKQTNEHNALADAKWNQELHKFIKSLQ